MRDIFLFGVTLVLLIPGISIPFVAGLGYVWSELVIPQGLAHGFMAGIPMNFVFALVAAFAVLVSPQKHVPPQKTLIWLLLLWGAWVTLTLNWAVAPVFALEKWNWVIKVILFSAFLPFLFRTRIQIEAFFTVVIFSVGVITLGGAVKTLISGGGYGMQFGMTAAHNKGLAEGSTLALFAVMLMPIALHFANHSLIFFKRRFALLVFWGFAGAMLLTAVGTHARTGLVALGVLAVLQILGQRHKFRYLAALAVLVALIAAYAPASWKARMATIETHEQDTSASTRMLVWRWAYEFALTHPLGGGFDAYRDPSNVIEIHRVKPETGEVSTQIQRNRAFHNSYLEVFAEQGMIGAALYLGMIALALMKLLGLYRANGGARGQGDGEAWCASLALAMMRAIIVYLAGSTFIGIAFQPFIYYFVAMTVVLNAYCLSRDGLRTARSGRAPPASAARPGVLGRSGMGRSGMSRSRQGAAGGRPSARPLTSA
jgi:probable O-glycosylation ligase (exosortase A-associated)